MKIFLSNFIKAAGFASVLFVIASCKNDSTTTTSDDPKTENKDNTAAIAGIAFIRADSVIQGYDMYHDLKAEFEKLAKQKETEITGKANILQKDYLEFQRKYENGLMTRSEAEEQGQKLQRRQQELEVTGGKMREQLADEERVMLNKIQDALLKYIDKYNAEKKYSLILNNATVLYASPAMDITSEILKGMNQEYSANRTTTAPAK